MSVAAAYHNAASVVAHLEVEIDRVIRLSSPEAVEWTTDEYDNSIEVYGVTPSAVLHDALKAAGFSIVWQHDHIPPRGGCKCRAKRPEPA